MEIGVSYKTKNSGDAFALFENTGEREIKYITLDENKDFVSLRNEHKDE